MADQIADRRPENSFGTTGSEGELRHPELYKLRNQDGNNSVYRRELAWIFRTPMKRSGRTRTLTKCACGKTGRHLQEQSHKSLDDNGEIESSFDWRSRKHRHSQYARSKLIASVAKALDDREVFGFIVGFSTLWQLRAALDVAIATAE